MVIVAELKSIITANSSFACNKEILVIVPMQAPTYQGAVHDGFNARNHADLLASSTSLSLPPLYSLHLTLVILMAGLMEHLAYPCRAARII